MMAGRTIYLVRHADTSMNASAGAEKERGWSNVPLDAEGRSEAKRIASKLAKCGVKAIVSSDLPRAKQTADIASDWLGVSSTVDSGLRTWDTGKCAGQLKSKVEPHIIDLVRHHPNEACSGGESFDAFCRRIRKALVACIKGHTENPMAIIIHARVERLLAATDYLEDRKVNVDTFLSKPAAPGHIEKWTVNPGSLS